MRVARKWHRGAARSVRRALCLLGVGTLPACELTEVTTAPGADLVVVEAVLQAGATRQVVLLHRSIQQERVRPESGAEVVVIAPGGREYQLVERPLNACADGLTPEATDSLTVSATCYTTPDRSGLSVIPGSTYELRVVTGDGLTIRGRTTVPGWFALHTLSEGSDLGCALPPQTNFPLSWSVSAGAWSYIAGMEITGLKAALAGSGIEAPNRLELTGVAVSELDTTLVVPAEVGIFEIADANQELLKLLQSGFPAGVSVQVVISAADRNLVNSVRGGGFNPSGNTRISSVVGDGLGVFGSLVPLTLHIQVGTDPTRPACPLPRA